MGYSPESTERILGCLGYRFDPAQKQALTKIAAEAWDKHTQEMSVGALAIRSKFLGFFNQVSPDSRLRTKFSFSPNQPPTAAAIDHKYFKSKSKLCSVIFNTAQDGVWYEYVDRFNKFFLAMINRALGGSVDVQLVSGAKKNPATIDREIRARYENAIESGDNDGAEKIYGEDIKWVRDTIRAQAICSTLQDVEKVIEILLRNNRMDKLLVAAMNAYSELFTKKSAPENNPNYIKPFMACMLYFEATANLTFELQVMTTRSKIVNRLTHPGIERSHSLQEDMKELIETLVWAANCLDYQEYLTKN